MKRILACSLVLLLAFSKASVTHAQAGGPVYVVQEGDSYWHIADVFKVTVDDLLAANGFRSNHIINPGDRLSIPGYEGIQGILSSRTVELGETLSTLAMRYGIPEDMLLRLNRLVNPERLYAAQTLIVVEPDAGTPALIQRENGQTLSLSQGTPLLAMAAAEGINPWDLVAANGLSSAADQFSGQTLIELGGTQPLRAWPSPLTDISFRPPLPLVQGTTEELTLALPLGSQAEGTLGDWNLMLRPTEGGLSALQGIYVESKPHTYPLILKMTLRDGRVIYFQQDVLLVSGDYITEAGDLTVPPETLDPATIQSESELINSVVAPFTEARYWEGVFLRPITGGISSYFGNWRTYNGGEYATFHGGMDFYAQEKAPIHAPAPGRVVFADHLVICGNTTIIDHGWGVYTRYCHQNKIEVQVGEMVQAGQEIGLIGHTGRADGPHLHWEVWVNGVQVNPLQWLAEAFP
jgi:murein DD-endopeptidase MepM/ murein hydrolase activator NlpD